MIKRAHIVIYGDVIGVGFRSWISMQAKKLGLTGWVRNVGEGACPESRWRSGRRVEAVFEGEEEGVKKMIKLCKKGPEVAWVERVDAREEKPTGKFVGFGIKY
jgi:acylphosphatase